MITQRANRPGEQNDAQREAGKGYQSPVEYRFWQQGLVFMLEHERI